MTVFVLKCRATGFFCAGVDTGRKAVMVTRHLDHAEAWATQAQADAAGAALAGAGGAFDWRVEERQGDVAARLMARLMAGAVPQQAGLCKTGELTEGQFYAVREMVRILNAAVTHLDRQAGQLEEAGIRFDDRDLTAVYDRLWAIAAPFEVMILGHMAAHAEKVTA